MEKHCCWIYLDGTLNKNGQECGFVLPAKAIWKSKLQGRNPRVVQFTDVLKSICLEQQVLLDVGKSKGGVQIADEPTWKELNVWLVNALIDYGYLKKGSPPQSPYVLGECSIPPDTCSVAPDNGLMWDDRAVLGTLRLDPFHIADEQATFDIDAWRSGKYNGYTKTYVRQCSVRSSHVSYGFSQSTSF